jgi:phosphoketolase
MRGENSAIWVYLPPDANTLLSVTDHCLRSRNYVKVVVAGKQPATVWRPSQCSWMEMERKTLTARQRQFHRF